jgi:disulfide bond formation protein DsbB
MARPLWPVNRQLLFQGFHNMLFSYRTLNALGFLACLGGMAFALWLQSQGLEPCPMCIFQRVAMMGAGAFFLIAALHGPRSSGFRGTYLVLTALCTLAGAGIAARHVWLQSLPPDQVPACGPTLDYLMQIFPLTEVVTMILKGDGNCAKISGQWLGITLPGWTLIAFVGLSVWAFLIPLLARKPKAASGLL